MVNLQTKTVQSVLFDQTTKTKTAESSEADFVSSYKSTDDAQVATKTKTKREVSEEKTAEEVKAFFEKMQKDGGAASFTIKMNLEKIEELIKKREDELKDAYGVNAKPPLAPEKMKEAVAAVKKGVAEYRKELMKELEDKVKDETQNKIKTQHSKIMQNPLAELLQQIA